MLSRIVAEFKTSQIKDLLRTALVESQKNTPDWNFLHGTVRTALRSLKSQDIQPIVLEKLDSASKSQERDRFQLDLNDALFYLAH